MLVFVDESGDAGMKKKEGSSKYFIVTAILFEDHDEATACDNHIDLVRQQLQLPENAEFHFSKCSNRIRQSFLEETVRFNYFYLAFAPNKAELYGPGFQFKDSFYKYTVNLLFQNAKPYLDNAIVTVDRSGRKEFRSQLSRYLKSKINDGGNQHIKKVKTQPSHNNNLLQPADMVCGAITKYFKKSPEFRRVIQARELELADVAPKHIIKPATYPFRERTPFR